MAAKDIVAALRALLVAEASVTALVSTRIYLGYLPESSALPAISLDQVGLSGERHLQGRSRMGGARVQVQCHDKDRAAAYAVAGAVDTYLLDNATLGAWGAITVQEVERDNLAELTDLDGDRVDRTVITDYSIWYEE